MSDTISMTCILLCVMIYSKTVVDIISALGPCNLYFTVQGPVVQSFVSLTSSLRGQLIKCFTAL